MRIRRRIRNAFRRAGRKIRRAFRMLGAALGNLWRDLVTTLANFFTTLFNNPWTALKGLIKGLIKTVGNAVRTIINAIVDLIGGVLGLITAIFGEKVSGWFSDNLADFIRQILDIVVEIPLSIAQGAVDFVLNLLEAIGVGIFTKNRSRAPELFKKAFSNALSIIFEVVAIVLGKLVLAFTVLLGREDPGDYLVEVLSQAELSLLQEIFERGVNLDIVRYKVGGAGLVSRLGDDNRPICLGNTIYFKNMLYLAGVTPPALNFATVLHELIHVWQFQNGGLDYTIRSLWSQIGGADPYLWQNDVPAVIWEDLGVEKQAQLIEDALTNGAFSPASTCFLCFTAVPTGVAPTVTLAQLDNYLARSVQLIRSGLGAP